MSVEITTEPRHKIHPCPDYMPDFPKKLDQCQLRAYHARGCVSTKLLHIINFLHYLRLAHDPFMLFSKKDSLKPPKTRLSRYQCSTAIHTKFLRSDKKGTWRRVTGYKHIKVDAKPPVL